MVSVEKIQKGAARFVDVEMLPKLDGKDRWIVAAGVSLYLSRLPAIIQGIKNNPAVKILNIISEDGQSIDFDMLISSIKPAAQQTPASFKIPFGGTLNFTIEDIETLKTYIMQA